MNNIIYKLTLDDLYEVADDLGIDPDDITPEVVARVKQDLEDSIEWTSPVEIALKEALNND